jgi:RND family efflux transporter MFP subunit
MMAGWIRSGEGIQVSVEAYPDKTFTGKLTRTNPVVDPQSRSFEVEALLDNSEGLLKPGFFAKARIPSGKVDRVLAVPRDALQYSYGVYKVCVIEGDVLKEREVRIGELEGDDAEIVSGVTTSDRIAVPVNGRALKDGAKVQIVQ